MVMLKKNSNELLENCKRLKINTQQNRTSLVQNCVQRKSTRLVENLFYHIRLRCYIVCELKAKPFEPEFAGKLNYYVNAVDELLKTDDENPTIGLLVCSDMNKIDVQWSFKGISTPMGVATYNNIRINDALPSQEQLTERVRLLQKELQETKRLMNKNDKID